MSKNRKNTLRENPEIEKEISSTPSQIEIWLECKFGGEQASKAYNESVSLNLKGDFSVDLLEVAFNKVIERHEAMRSIVSPTGKKFIVFKTYDQPIGKSDISSKSPIEKDSLVKKHLEEIGAFSFNYSRGPLYRLDLIKLEEREYLLTFTGHHLIFDGWSLGVLVEELGAIYSELLSGNHPSLPKADLLSDYSKEIFNLIQNSNYGKTIDFWRSGLSNPIPRFDLPIDNIRHKLRTYDAEVHKNHLTDETFVRLRSIGDKLGSSPNLTLLAIFEIFLHVWTKQDDIIVGVPISGQIMLNKRHLIGHCVNLLPLRSRIKEDSTFSEYLQIRKSEYYIALKHSSISFGEMIKIIQYERDPSRAPLIPVTFNIDHGMNIAPKFDGLEHDLMFNPKSFSNFELIVDLFKISSGYVLNWTYNSNLFNKSTIKMASERFLETIDLLLENPNESISKIAALLGPKLEKKAAEPLEFQPVGGLIRKQLHSKKSKIALKLGDKEYSYEYINDLTNTISNQLLMKDVGPGQIVGVHLDRTIELVASALAVVQLGACYMPIDAEYPEARVKFMLNDVNVKAFITDNDAYSWDNLSDRRIRIDKHDASKQALRFDTKSPAPNDPLFIVYTSGSTGNPKGVSLSQKNLSDFLHHFSIAPNLNEDDVVLGLTSISFDMSFMELILPFAYGATLHLLDRFERRDSREIAKTVKNSGITKLFATPSHLKSIIEHGLTEKQKKLTIISAGEPLQLSLAQALCKAGAKVYNIYGPTETTIFTNIKEITPQTELITIGKPVEGTDIFLLDEKGNLVSKAGELGEIYIGGSGVGIGYLNREELTREKFTVNPLPNKKGRYYKTGDLGIWTDEGELICKGRIDHQVKIRGQRLELGEIENRIAQDTDIKNVIVEKIVSENGDDNLVAFVSFKNNKIDSGIWIDTCKQNLSKVLSDFMIPSHFIVVENFELNSNGKIDRNATKLLIKSTVKGIQNNTAQTKIHSKKSNTFLKVKELWEEVLTSPDSKVDVSFFQAGGHSLLAVDLITKIENNFALNLPLSFLFEYSTISAISDKLDQILDTRSDENEVLLKIKNGSPDKVLFFIHGIGLNPLEINTLKNHMDEDQTIWGLQSPMIHNSKSNPLESIETIAEVYLSEIKRKKIVGPYKFLGNSIGGQIAFEMAKQLRRMGEVVGFLGMIDTIRSPLSNVPKSTTGKIKMFSGKIIFEFQFFIDDPIYYLTYRANYLKENINKHKKVTTSGEFSDLKARINQIESYNMNAWKKYKHEYVDIGITLFMAKKKTFFVPDSKTFGWSPYVNDIHIIQLPGDHATMLKPPHGIEFCIALQKELTESDRKI